MILLTAALEAVIFLFIILLVRHYDIIINEKTQLSDMLDNQINDRRFFDSEQMSDMLLEYEESSALQTEAAELLGLMRFPQERLLAIKATTPPSVTLTDIMLRENNAVLSAVTDDLRQTDLHSDEWKASGLIADSSITSAERFGSRLQYTITLQWNDGVTE